MDTGHGNAHSGDLMRVQRKYITVTFCQVTDGLCYLALMVFKMLLIVISNNEIVALTHNIIKRDERNICF